MGSAAEGSSAFPYISLLSAISGAAK
jgi:hypothetical protein